MTNIKSGNLWSSRISHGSLIVMSIILLEGCINTARPGNGQGPAEPGTPGYSTRHCVANVSSHEVSCYSTFREAIAFATGGRVTDAPDAKVAGTDESFARRLNALRVAPDTTIVIGIDFVDANYQGAVFIWTAPSGCDGNLSTIDWQFTSLSQVGWNDTISSFHSYSNCRTVLYEHDNFGGAQTPLAVDLSYVGDAMNDRASSIRWF